MRFFENTRKPQGFGGKLMTKMMNSGHAKLSQWGFSNISAKPDAEVLDVGCGGGANIAVWLDRCRNGHVTGMDYSEVSVAESQKLNALAIKQGKCNVVQGDVSAIPFSDATFDYVSAFETVYFWPGLVKCFSEVNRVLKSEGIFLICNESDGTNAADEKWTKMINGMKIYTSKQLVAALKEAGFTEIKTYSNAKNQLDKYCCNEIANFQLEERNKNHSCPLSYSFCIFFGSLSGNMAFIASSLPSFIAVS